MNRFKAFTLIELLVVIAIIGILSGFIFVSLSGALDAAQDAKRKADVASIEKAIMVYKTLGNPLLDTSGSCELIPDGSGCDIVNDPNFQDYLKNIPTDPDGNTYYIYSSDGIDFTVAASLSNGNIYYYDSTTGFSEQPSEPPELPNLFADWHKAWININNSGSEIANYQIRVPVNFVPGIQDDFGDIRFGSNDGSVAYDYWMESKIDGSSAVFWVKVPIVPAGESHFSIFYNHTTGTIATTSNGNNTFEFFDDFLGTSLDTNKWTTGTLDVSVSAGSAIFTGTASVHKSKHTTVTFGTNYAVRARSKNYNITTARYCYLGFGTYETNQNHSATYDQYLSNTRLYTTNNGASTLNPNNLSVDFDFHVWEIIRNASTSVILYKDAETSNNTTNISSWSLPVQVNIYGQANVEVDWFLVRKYISSEPTYQSITFLE